MQGLHRDLARKLSTLVPPHPIGNDEEVAFLQQQFSIHILRVPDGILVGRVTSTDTRVTTEDYRTGIIRS
jgi:hypothetical protein